MRRQWQQGDAAADFTLEFFKVFRRQTAGDEMQERRFVRLVERNSQPAIIHQLPSSLRQFANPLGKLLPGFQKFAGSFFQRSKFFLGLGQWHFCWQRRRFGSFYFE